VGDWVEIKSAEEIFATLDDRGRLDALPFMPEMLQYCGKRFQVFRSAHKTCDTIESYKGRRIENTVHLEGLRCGLRCDGKAHGGCQAACLLFWKEAWLRPVTGAGVKEQEDPGRRDPGASGGSAAETSWVAEVLNRATRKPAENGNVEAEHYSCQATELLRATKPLRWWEPGPYLRDLTSGNMKVVPMVRFMAIAAFNTVMRWLWRGKPFDVYPHPYLRGMAGEKTPTDRLNLQPGELVEVKSKDEIMRTLNSRLRNRGLSFDVEAAAYCGKIFRVRDRVERIINEKTGAMMRLSSDCIVLEGASCSGCYSNNRLFCPRSIYPFWREIWLRRVDGKG
jgi:hypothetical protein